MANTYPLLWISPLMGFVLVQVMFKEACVLDVLADGNWGIVFRFSRANRARLLKKIGLNGEVDDCGAALNEIRYYGKVEKVAKGLMLILR